MDGINLPETEGSTHKILLPMRMQKLRLPQVFSTDAALLHSRSLGP